MSKPTYGKSNIPHPNHPGKRLVGFIIAEGDEAFGERGLSEPLKWLGTLCCPGDMSTVPPGFNFAIGDPVRKKKGSEWKGRVVGYYQTELTPEGYAVESFTEKGSVQIYPFAALELIPQSELKVSV